MIDTLKDVQEDRRCYRMIGGVLCASTVKNVLPELTASANQLETMVKKMTEEMSK